MKALITILCATLPVCAAAQRSPGFELFPHDTPFRTPVAHPAEPRVYLSRISVKRAAGDFSAAVTGLGYDFGLVRHQGAAPDSGWQLSLFGSADSIFNSICPATRSSTPITGWGCRSRGGTSPTPRGCACITRARISATS